MSLDEAYLDITHLVRPDLPASQIANYIRRDIYEKDTSYCLCRCFV